MMSRVAQRDPLTGLATETFLREEFDRQWSLHELTQGKIKGGFVVGLVDALAVYKQTLETEGQVDPAKVSQRVSDVLRGVGVCVRKRANEHTLDQSTTYRAGVAGRMGKDGFGVCLPLLKDFEIAAWASRLAKDVLDRDFEGERLLEAGDISVSLRIIPFGPKGPRTAAEAWKTAKAALSEIEKEQLRARKDIDRLLTAVNTVRILHEGKWLPASEWRNVRVP
jgi:GGDEF domain-containing protein